MGALNTRVRIKCSVCVKCEKIRMKMSFYYLSLALILLSNAHAASKPQFNHIKYALVKTSKVCISPYENIGKQCLYFSRPYEPWGITKSWDQAYKSFYGAAIFCLENGGF